MKNDSTSFFENNHFANSYVYDISISHVPAYFGLHWHHYIEIVPREINPRLSFGAMRQYL